MDELLQHCRELIARYPEHKPLIVETYQNAACEVSSGESEDNETALAMEFLKDEGLTL